MLARTAARYAFARPSVIPTPRAPAAQWIKSYAKNNSKNRRPQQPAAPQPNRNASPTAKSSEQTGEFNAGASPEKNTAPKSAPGPGATSAAAGASAAKESTDYSPVQEEFNSPQSPDVNTAPETEKPSQPLPDLRHGLPSTFEAEFLKQTSQAKEDAPDPSVNITEDPTVEASSSGSGRGGTGREGGELPKSAYETSTDRRRNQVANLSFLAGAISLLIGGTYVGRPWESEEEAKQHSDTPAGWSPSAIYARAHARLSGQVSYYTEPVFPKLLPEVDPAPPMTLVLSLEDLLIHSEWSREHGWRMAKRPGVDYFLRYLCQYYELVIFTSLPMQAADPVIRKLDPFRVVMWPLFREATRYEKGEYIKDLSYLNRDLSKVILVDTKAEHAKNQPENAIILPKWNGQPGDKGLVSLIPFLEYVATMGITDVRTALKAFEGKDIATEFAIRENRMREEFHKQLAEDQRKKPKKSLGGAFASSLGLKPTGPQGGLLVGEESASEGFAKGKMLFDQIRERGQKQYQAMDKEIRENGEKWLKEMAEEEKKVQEETMKSMKSGIFGMFGGSEKPEGK